MFVPEEAILKAGGTQPLLEAAVRSGRVIKAMQGKLPMYFFPRREYSRESLVRQKLAAADKKVTDGDEIAKAQEDLFQDWQWDPSTLIPASLDSIGQGIPTPMLAGPSSAVMAPPVSMATKTSAGSLYLLSLEIYTLSSHLPNKQECPPPTKEQGWCLGCLQICCLCLGKWESHNNMKCYQP